jgi:hypothetical protein
MAVVRLSQLVVVVSVVRSTADGPAGMCLFDLDGTLTTLQVWCALIMRVVGALLCFM